MIGFPATLLICAAVSLIGVLIIRYALTLEKPVVNCEVASADRSTDNENQEEVHDISQTEDLSEELEHVVTSSQE